MALAAGKGLGANAGLQFDGSCKSMCSFQWPRTAALSQDVRKKNRLNVNPEIPVRKGGAADTLTHTHTGTEDTHRYKDRLGRNCTYMFSRMFTMCSTKC